jgi:hypothetical protein
LKIGRRPTSRGRKSNDAFAPGRHPKPFTGAVIAVKAI